MAVDSLKREKCGKKAHKKSIEIRNEDGRWGMGVGWRGDGETVPL